MTKTELKAFANALKKRQVELEIGNRSRGALAIETSPDESIEFSSVKNVIWRLGLLIVASNCCVKCEPR